MKISSISPRFVEFIPRELADGVLYISEPYATASHKCACGCGEKVVTPLSPADWQLRKNGDMVSLHPSIGNWNYDCRSHYWIRNNRIIWSSQLNSREIDRIQRRDLLDKARHIDNVNRQKESLARPSVKADEKMHMHQTREKKLSEQFFDWCRHLFRP